MASLDTSLRGIAAIVAAQVAFLLNDTLTKLVGERLPLGEVIFIRGVAACLFVGGLVVALGQHRMLASLTDRHVPWRILCELGGTLFFLLALMRLPIAYVIIIFQAVPLSATAGAALFLGEQVGWHRWLAIVAGFIGVVLVIRPGLEGFDVPAILVLISVLFISARDLVTRVMPPVIPPLLVTLATALAVTLMGALMSLGEDWRAPAWRDTAALALASIFLAAGYLTSFLAMRWGDMSVTAPFRYVAVVLAISVGYIVWGDVPDGLALLGAAVIVAAGFYTVIRERRRSGRSGGIAAVSGIAPPRL